MSDIEELQEHIIQLRKRGGGSTTQPIELLQSLLDRLTAAESKLEDAERSTQLAQEAARRIAEYNGRLEHERDQTISRIEAAEKQEPIATTCARDTEDSEPGVRFSARDWLKLNVLPPYTKLYALPPIPAVPEGYTVVKMSDIVRIFECLPVDPIHIPEGMQFNFPVDLANDALRMIAKAVKSMLAADGKE